MTAPAKAKYRLDMLKSHTVYKNAAGQRLPGVTTILGMLDKPALLPWAWGLGQQGIKLEAARQLAADTGTVAHALCEAHLRGMEFDAENIAPAMLKTAETCFLHFLTWWDAQGLQLVSAEHPMVSETLQVGGTADIIAEGANWKTILCDLKSGKALYPEMDIQAAVYAAMYEETTGRPVDEVYVIRIPKEPDEALEVKLVTGRPEKVAAFAALAEARRKLLAAGMKL